MSLAAKVHDPLNEISAEVSRVTGVQLGEKQRPMVAARVHRRQLQLGLLDIHLYFDYFLKNRSTELDELVSLLTTHHTFFFREFLQFEHLEKNLPQLIEKVRARGDNVIRVWSAACSKGHEVYSLAMFLDHHLKTLAPDLKYHILGSDVDKQSIEICRNGVYPRREIKDIPLTYLGQHWARGTGEIAEFVKVKKTLQNNCEFQMVNLLDLSSIQRQKKFDLIFCRNVFIYFTQAQIENCVVNLAKTLEPHGHFYVSVSESLQGLKIPLSNSGPSIYSWPAATPKVASNVAMENVSASPQPAKSKPIRVLCVDDSPSILALLKQVFAQGEGFEVVGTAQNGIEAWSKVNELRPDVVTLDIHMPQQSGVEYLRSHGGPSHPPVIMVTSVSREDSELALQALQLGASDYVEKPSLSNFSERADEIRTKVRVGIRARQSSSTTQLHVLDQQFERKADVAGLDSKLRLVLCSVADQVKLQDFLLNLKKPQPPTFFLVEGSLSILPRFAQMLNQPNGWSVEYSDNLNLTPPSNICVVMDARQFFATSPPHLRQRLTSICVYGEVSEQLATAVQGWSQANIILEETRLSKRLLRLAADVVPATSFAHNSTEYLIFGKRAA